MNYGTHKYKGQDFPVFWGYAIDVEDDSSDPNAPAYAIRFIGENNWYYGMDDDDIDWLNDRIKTDNDEDNESQKHDESIPDIDYHFKRVKSIQHHSFDTTKGNLMARIFLRHVGSTYDQKGNYIINEKDLFAWFENLDYLRIYSEFDTF